MDTPTIVAVLVAAVVVLVLLALLVVLLRRRSAHTREQRLASAEELRGRAASHDPDVRSAAQEARVADAQAERARAQAQQAEQVAEGAHRRLAHEQATQEDVVRRADELDPRIDTSAPDYEPVTGPALKGAHADDVVAPTTPTDPATRETEVVDPAPGPATQGTHRAE
ncbi:hypothetical protein [Nocardioides rubriscoriae]|uniref:hypothetical protein n=1 Tax=Nocardioides rubriscoriae TaxID=642762 RepID=UPI0011DF9671|nr:hypothetical protein [Nocardioides rubriscoriae]